MQIMIDIPEQVYLNAKADTLCGADILVKAIKNGIPHETVTEFADRCRECGARYGKYRKEAKRWKNKWLKSQKSGKWIPVSERLPEIKQHVLLSCYGRVIYGRMISEDGNSGYPIFEICDSVGEKRPIVLETTVHSEYTTSRIKAWMPLPIPYEPQESEVQDADSN